MNQDYKSRNRQIVKWRNANVSQMLMASRLGITRQRVQQIERALGLGRRRIPGVYKKYTFKCKQCEKEVSIRTSGRIYCGRSCFFQSRKIILTPQEDQARQEKRKEKNRMRALSYYHQVFKKRVDWKDILKTRNEKYAKKKK